MAVHLTQRKVLSSSVMDDIERSWSVGELARATGVTVRTLRYYGAIGLVVPERSHAGHRRYAERDVRRLYAALALRSLGLSLSEVKALLERARFDPRQVVRRQLEQLDRQREVTERLRERLIAVLDALEVVGEPSIEDLIRQSGVMREMEFVCDGLDGFNHGDLAAVEAVLAPDVNWFAVPPDPAVCRDRSQVLRRLGELANEGEKFELDELVEAGDRLAVASRDTDGSLWWWVFTVRDGKVVRMEDQPSREGALQAIGQ